MLLFANKWIQSTDSLPVGLMKHKGRNNTQIEYDVTKF